MSNNQTTPADPSTTLPPLSHQTTLTPAGPGTTLPVSLDQATAAATNLFGTAHDENFNSNYVFGFNSVSRGDDVFSVDSCSGTDDLFVSDDMWNDLVGGQDVLGLGDLVWTGDVLGHANPFDADEMAANVPSGDSMPWSDQTNSIQSPASMTNTEADVDPFLSLFPDDVQHFNALSNLPMYDPPLPMYPRDAQLDDDQVYSPYSVPQDNPEGMMHISQPRSNVDYAGRAKTCSNDFLACYPDYYRGFLHTVPRPQSSNRTYPNTHPSA